MYVMFESLFYIFTLILDALSLTLRLISSSSTFGRRLRSFYYVGTMQTGTHDFLKTSLHTDPRKNSSTIFKLLRAVLCLFITMSV